MALNTDVKNYVACWMQLGTKLWLRGGQHACQVQHVLDGERYSAEFEHCWQQALETTSGDCYLDGTTVTLSELMGQTWEIVDCARCNMPVALPTAGLPPAGCTCQSLDNWPNTEVPLPRPPISTIDHLRTLQHRLRQPT